MSSQLLFLLSNPPCQQCTGVMGRGRGGVRVWGTDVVKPFHPGVRDGVGVVAGLYEFVVN